MSFKKFSATLDTPKKDSLDDKSEAAPSALAQSEKLAKVPAAGSSKEKTSQG